MKALQHILIGITVLLGLSNIVAQPYTLDKNIKPVKLELRDDKKYDGAKGIATNASILGDEINYFFVKGHDLFQFIDVYIFSNYGDPALQATLVKDNWNDNYETQNTKSSKDGIINFKLRTYGDFGFKITSPNREKINYTIIVYATEPVMEYLDTPFVKASKADMEEADATAMTNESSSGGNSNMILYIALGAALLVIGFLAAKVLGNKKSTNILLFLLLFVPFSGIAQYHGGGFWDPDNVRNGDYEEWLRNQSERHQQEGFVGDMEGLKRLSSLTEDLNGKLDGVLKKYKVIKELYDAYTGLGDCINSVPLPGAPRVPTFCESAECGSCFTDARRRLQETRYTFEKLKTIYVCTKNFSDKAIAFGDNVSGVHGVSGMAWQAERIKIEKSVRELQKAYDNKYIELLQDFQNALVDLNNCEAEHGIADWYDRFGYLYYDFIKFHYTRQN
ncbi:hypothetical protein [Constantimarinum furrinae]|uniref:Uncharacterized protein n=1 Tax=Constantimarinum furrinae TaxID=2562285 RepID=A0A7G8PUF2_9FLAO|nr:hypothetical protein [Constantimarinum furrinae]QNJ97968.1 hypothetical protein ALE3EI_1406 [Constantimarinum furrinae]